MRRCSVRFITVLVLAAVLPFSFSCAKKIKVGPDEKLGSCRTIHPTLDRDHIAVLEFLNRDLHIKSSGLNIRSNSGIISEKLAHIDAHFIQPKYILSSYLPVYGNAILVLQQHE